MAKNKAPKGYVDRVPKGYRYIPDNSAVANKKMLEAILKRSPKQAKK